MEAYDQRSCNTLQKVFYKPIEAALRMCGLTSHEATILGQVGAQVVPPLGMFPQWPCLRLNTERILDAMANREIPIGRDGITVPDGEQVTPARRTIRHADLAVWMAGNWTGPIPAFMQAGDSPKPNETLGQRERNTLLIIIAALCKDAGYDYIKHAKTAGLIQSTAEKMGVSIGETTIEGYLKKIPDALGSRAK